MLHEAEITGEPSQGQIHAMQYSEKKNLWKIINILDFNILGTKTIRSATCINQINFLSILLKDFVIFIL